MVANTNTDTTPVAGQNSGTPLTIREALAEARKYVHPGQTAAITMEVWDYPCESNTGFSIWDGDASFRSKSLRGALDALISFHTGKREEFVPADSEALATEAHQIIEAQH